MPDPMTDRYQRLHGSDQPPRFPTDDDDAATRAKASGEGLRAGQLDTALGRMDESDLWYDSDRRSAAGEPMDPDLYVRYDALRAALAADSPVDGGLDVERLLELTGRSHPHDEGKDCGTCEAYRLLDAARLQPATPEAAAPIRSPAGFRVTIAAGTSVDGVIGPAATPEAAVGEDYLRGDHELWPGEGD